MVLIESVTYYFQIFSKPFYTSMNMGFQFKWNRVIFIELSYLASNYIGNQDLQDMLFVR